MLKFTIFLALTVMYRHVLGDDFQCYRNQTTHFTDLNTAINRRLYGALYQTTTITAPFPMPYPASSDVGILLDVTNYPNTLQCNLDDDNETISEVFKSLSSSDGSGLLSPLVVRSATFKTYYNSTFYTCGLNDRKGRVSGDYMKTPRICKRLKFIDVACQ